jgi:isopentenyl phosphate kinase
LVYGDVAFDAVLGGTIISTEEILAYLAEDVRPSWFLLAGDTDGVYDGQGVVIPRISEGNFAEIRAALGGSEGTDVTGGMAAKVREMLDLVKGHPGLQVRIFSGLEDGRLRRTLLNPEGGTGTLISA